jgi:hypothetical protein
VDLGDQTPRHSIERSLPTPFKLHQLAYGDSFQPYSVGTLTEPDYLLHLAVMVRRPIPAIGFPGNLMFLADVYGSEAEKLHGQRLSALQEVNSGINVQLQGWRAADASALMGLKKAYDTNIVTQYLPTPPSWRAPNTWAQYCNVLNQGSEGLLAAVMYWAYPVHGDGPPALLVFEAFAGLEQLEQSLARRPRWLYELYGFRDQPQRIPTAPFSLWLPSASSG